MLSLTRAIKRSGCFHKNGHDAGCHVKNNVFMIIFGFIEIILSQIPNLHELSGLSVVAAIMSFAYSTIGLGLSIAKLAGQETMLKLLLPCLTYSSFRELLEK